MRSGRARAEAEPLGFVGQRFDVAGHRVVALVTVEVDHQSAPGRDLA